MKREREKERETEGERNTEREVGIERERKDWIKCFEGSNHSHTCTSLLIPRVGRSSPC